MKKLFLFLALLFLSVPGWSATYYVRTDGHNTASGLNNTNNATTGAWLTIGKGASTASAGDTVIINDGKYPEGLITFSRSGTAVNLITFRAANNRQTILEGGFKITGNYVKVDGLKITYNGSVTHPAWASGNYNEIRNNWIVEGRGEGALYATGTYNILDNNYLTNPQTGIELSGDYNTASNNEVNGLTWLFSGDDSDYVRFFGTGQLMKNNYLHGADMAVIADTYGAHVDCFQTFDNARDTHDAIIDGNICDTAHQGGMITAVVNSRTSGITYRNNIIMNMRSWQILVWEVDDVYVYNNIFYNSAIKGVGATTGGHIAALRNNIFYNGSHPSELPYFSENGGSISNADHNLLYKTSGSFTQSDYPNDIVNLNPNFVSSSDFHLQAGSPAIDKGSTISGFSTDIIGTSRPQGSAWDIGAYELIKIPQIIPLKPNAPGFIMIN